MRIKTLVQNQHTRELIIVWKTSNKHNHKDPSRRYSPGGFCVPCIYQHARWELPQATQVFVAVFE